jgi:hypothetical protein
MRSLLHLEGKVLQLLLQKHSRTASNSDDKEKKKKKKKKKRTITKKREEYFEIEIYFTNFDHNSPTTHTNY